MAFSVQRRKRTSHRQPEAQDYDVALRFSKLVDNELGEFLKSAVLFGSCAVHEATKASDIDVLLIVDDVTHIVNQESIDHYQRIVVKAATKSSNRLHINTLKLTNFWEYCREGDPVVTSMLRDGVVLLDKGVFAPLQLLLEQGRIRPTKEAIWTYYSRTTNTLRSARQHIMTACVDLYWAAMDASHSALMSVGEIPASPEHVPDLLEHALVKKGMLDKHYPKIMRELYHLQKGILHREIKEISGEQYEAYWNETLRLVDALRTVVERAPPKQ